MATLSFEPASEFYDEPIPCEVRTCSSLADVRVEQTHMDDGESWPMCRTHAVEAAVEQMEWVANDGEVPDPAAGPVGVPAEQPLRCDLTCGTASWPGHIWCELPDGHDGGHHWRTDTAPTRPSVAEPLVADPPETCSTCHQPMDSPPCSLNPETRRSFHTIAGLGGRAAADLPVPEEKQ